MGLPPCTTANGCFHKYNQNGGTVNFPAFDAGWAQETALDLDMASALCPKCKISLVEGFTNSFADLGAAENQAALKNAHVISNSYGASEFSGVASLESFYTHPGIAITVSSGDFGYGVEYPASSPHVTAVGGTSLVRSWGGRGWTETAWSGAGSGCSTQFAKPVWQTDPLCSHRTVADVSAVADPATGVAVYGPISSTTSQWMVFGGTSVAAPIIAGIYGVNGGPVNVGQDPYNHVANLFDVTSGSNGSCGGTYLCTGAVGYDGPTGLGTPNGNKAF
jgi:subtilase family serine protease